MPIMSLFVGLFQDRLEIAYASKVSTPDEGDAFPNLIMNEPYLKYWNDTIFGIAMAYHGMPRVLLFVDSKWVDRVWVEFQVSIIFVCHPYQIAQQIAAGNGSQAFGNATNR